MALLLFGLYLVYKLRNASSEIHKEKLILCLAVPIELCISIITYCIRHALWNTLTQNELLVLYCLRCQLTVTLTLAMVLGPKVSLPVSTDSVVVATFALEVHHYALSLLLWAQRVNELNQPTDQQQLIPFVHYILIPLLLQISNKNKCGNPKSSGPSERASRVFYSAAALRAAAAPEVSGTGVTFRANYTLTI